jgi:transglutaminase-like putative cysteine protease
MSGMAAAAPVRPAGARRREAADVAVTPAADLALRVTSFAALCLFAVLHWNQLVTHAPVGRAIAVAAIAAAAAAGMGALGAGLTPLGTRAARVAQLLLVPLTLAGAMLAIGLPARFLAPGHWADLVDGVDRGVTGTSTISWPYTGGEPWIRMTILLAIPAAATLAAALAFVPTGRRARAAGRMAGLVVLVALYAFAVTEISLGSPVTRGMSLLVLIGAWQWLPRVHRADAAAAAGVVLAAGVIAIPFSSALDVDEPWIHWQQWSWFSAAGGERFQWDHRYGPLDWPRTGRTLLTVKSSRPHYWKAETLDHFDGVRWAHSSYYAATDVAGSLPQPLNPRWMDTIHVSLRGLRTDVLIGAGTVVDYNGPHAVATSGDGTTRIVDGSAARGETYDIRAYVPDPSAPQMRAAPPDSSSGVQPYIAFDLPPRSLSGAAQLVRLSPWNEPATADPRDVATVLASPYRRVYQLSRQLAQGERTTYDVVKRVESYLEDHYTYNESPPAHRYPLPAFLFADRDGYCQQFSGAMALMLRMNGIPARVAAGFAPGLYDSTNKEYRVRDFDAHSWVEVWFKGIGWVPFDPTPTTSPASSQSTGSAAASAANGDSHDSGSSTPGSKDRQQSASQVTTGGRGTLASLSMALGVIASLAVIVLAALWLAATIRARRLRHRHDQPAIAELAAALELLGHPVEPGTTLAQLERRLGELPDERAARYVRLLRDGRFSPHPGPGPSGADRRGLRASLTAGRGPLTRLRGFVALPPRLGEPRSAAF